MRRKDYRIYRMSWRDRLLWFFSTLIITGLISWLFYRSLSGLAAMLPLLFLTRRIFRNYLHAKQKREMLCQFGEMLQIMSSSLKAGYSMENAFLQSWEEYAKLYGQKSLMAQEFRNIIYQMKLNEPLEQLVEDFALRSGIEEISSFSQVFSFAKRG